MSLPNWRHRWRWRLPFQQLRLLHSGSLSVMFVRRCLLLRRRRAAAIGLFIVSKVIFAIFLVLSYSNSPTSSSSSNDELDPQLIQMFDSFQSADCVRSFLGHYEDICRRTSVKTGHVVGQRSMPTSGRPPLTDDDTPERPLDAEMELCPCVPRENLIGHIDPYKIAKKSLIANESLDDVVDVGGHWSPVNCVARQRLAIIVPFRNREAHLEVLLRVLHPMLQRQLVDYTIFVIEQEGRNTVFNKASLMNVGFLESRARAEADNVTGSFDCYVFHDVDMLPEDDRNFYGCGVRLPRHLGTYIDKYNYSLYYPRILGGVTSYRPDVFQLLNGFSNRFYGWGGEDDDMFYRPLVQSDEVESLIIIKSKGLSFTRYAKCVARYSMMKHGQDAMNPDNPDRYELLRKPRYHDDGLNTVRYKIISYEQRPLYTWLLVGLSPSDTHSK